MKYFTQLVALFLAVTSLAHASTSYDPINLSAEWWSSFMEAEETRQDNIADFQTHLAQIEEQLTVEQREKFDGTLERIRLNLRALPGALDKAAPTPSLFPELKESYSIDELLQLYQDHRDLQLELREDEESLTAFTRAIATAQGQIDRLLVAYKDSEEGSLQRLELGLERIASRLALLVTTEQLRVQKAALHNIESLVEAKGEVLEQARERLRPDPDFLTNYDSLLLGQQTVVDQAEDRILQLEAAMLGSYADGPLAKGTQSHLKQMLIQAEVVHGGAKAHLLRLRLRHRLHQALLEEKELSLTEWSSWLDELEYEVDQLTLAAEEWQWATGREYTRAGEGFGKANGSGNGAPLVALYRARLTTAQETMAELRTLNGTLADIDVIHELVQRELFDRQSRFKQILFYGWDFLRTTWNRAAGLSKKGLFTIGDIPVTPFGILRAIFIVALGFWLSNFMQKIITDMGAGHRRGTASNFYVVGRLAHYAILTLALVLSLASLGLDFSNLALVAGALSVGIGFGLQTIVSNFFSGLIILFEGNLRVGDFLELESGPRGRITSINVRSTIIRTNDGIEVVIPNAEIIGNRVINWTMSDVHRRIHVPFGVAYDTDKDLMVKAVMEAVAKVDCSLEPSIKYADPKVNLIGFGDNSLDFELVIWVDRQASKRLRGTSSRYLWEIHNAFLEHDIKIPFPQRDLNLISVPKGFNK